MIIKEKKQMVDFKSRLAQIKQQQETAKPSLKSRLLSGGSSSTPAAGASSLKSRLLGGGGSSTGGGGLRNKFKKRDQTILDKTYEDRNEKSKSRGTGRPLFQPELMEQFGVVDFQTTAGDRFVEVMPISFKPEVPYFTEMSVHFGVGFNNDAYICMNRLNQGRCYRCERQQVMWRDQVTYTKDQAKALYPADRCVYLLWERTKELVEGESPDYTLALWAAPKSKVHSEIQEKVRNKITRTTLDISDISIGGDGRTVGFTIQRNKGDYPEYRAFDLIERDKPIPDEIVTKLDAMITYAEENGFKNCIEMFYNFHEYDELKASMETEEEETEGTTSTGTTGTPSTGRPSLRSQSSSATPTTGVSTMEAQEEQLMAILEELQDELGTKSKNPLLWKNWCKTNGYEAALDMPPDEAIPAIIDDMYEKGISEIKGENVN